MVISTQQPRTPFVQTVFYTEIFKEGPTRPPRTTGGSRVSEGKWPQYGFKIERRECEYIL